MSDTPPDRLSTNPKSPHYRAEILLNVGVIFKGAERTNVLEYCVSEGWVRLRPRTQQGKHPRGVKLQGKVEPFFRTAQGG